MARGVNKVIPDPYEAYLSGFSMPEVSQMTGIHVSTLRSRFKKAGILRSRADGVRNAAKNGRLGSGFRGKTRAFSEDHKKAISMGRKEWAEKNAAGTRITSTGYVEFTRGPHKGRHEHVVIMESRIGRRIKPDEVVHHIDGCKTNNSINNLALCTRSGHSRLHRREESLLKINEGDK